MPFKAGQSGNPAGKPKGALSKFNADVKAMILGALSDVGGREYLARQAEQNPTAFMTLVGKVLPLQLANAEGQKLLVDFRWADQPAIPPTIESVAVDTENDKRIDNVSDETKDVSDETTVTFIGEC